MLRQHLVTLITSVPLIQKKKPYSEEMQKNTNISVKDEVVWNWA